MKKLLIMMLFVSLAACGGKTKKSTTPDNKTGTGDMAGSGSATGGTTYGGAQTPPPAKSGTADPCGGY